MHACRSEQPISSRHQNHTLLGFCKEGCVAAIRAPPDAPVSIWSAGGRKDPKCHHLQEAQGKAAEKQQLLLLHCFCGKASSRPQMRPPCSGFPACARPTYGIHLQVGQTVVTLRHPQPQCIAPALSAHQHVTLRLEPVGATWWHEELPAVIGLVETLVTLAAIHHHGFVHCDIRDDNIVSGPRGWLLIDWELAGPSGRQVFWYAKASPPGMAQGDHWLPQHDLWQLGVLMQAHLSRLNQTHPVADGLISGRLTAADALCALQAH